MGGKFSVAPYIWWIYIFIFVKIDLWFWKHACFTLNCLQWLACDTELKKISVETTANQVLFSIGCSFAIRVIDVVTYFIFLTCQLFWLLLCLMLSGLGCLYVMGFAYLLSIEKEWPIELGIMCFVFNSILKLESCVLIFYGHSRVEKSIQVFLFLVLFHVICSTVIII